MALLFFPGIASSMPPELVVLSASAKVSPMSSDRSVTYVPGLDPQRAATRRSGLIFKMMTISPAREIAFRVLLRVEDGAYASDLLRHESKELNERDASLAETIVMGALRVQSRTARFSDRAFRGAHDI